MDTTTTDCVTTVDTPVFLEWVRRSGVIPTDLFDAWLATAQTLGVPDAVARLVAANLLTGYQARQILQGKSRRLLLKGKYRVLDELGSGATGAVLLAEHVKMRKRVAIKVLPVRKAGDPVTLARFRREATALAALDHPNVIRALDCDDDDGLYFLAMEYAEGTDLHNLVRGRGPLPLDQAIDLVAQAATGLHHAHQAGWVHRDVKPANLLLVATGRVKVLDLGLARVFDGDDDRLTAEHDSGAVMGTVDFIAPEQTLDSSGVDHRADIYSLGATFYFLLAGHAPFPEGTVAHKLITRQVRDPAPIQAIRPDVPAHVAAVLARMMARNPDDRHASLAEVVQELQAPLPPTSLLPPVIEAPTATPVQPTTVLPATSSRRVPLVLTGVVAAVLAAVVVVGWTVVQIGRTTTAAPPSRSEPEPLPDSSRESASEVRIVRDAGRMEIAVGGKPFATYFTDPKYGQPFLGNLQAPSGRTLTEAIPEHWPLSGRYPGGWYFVPYQTAIVERASKLRLTRAGEYPETTPDGIRDVLSYIQGQRTGTAKIEETRLLHFSKKPNGVLVTWSSEMTSNSPSGVRTMQDANGFGIRLVKIPKFRAWEFQTPTERSHTLPPSLSPWIAAATVAEGRRWGVIAFAHPKNPVPSQVVSRLDNGVPEIRLVPKGPDEADETVFAITPERTFRMRFGVFVFDTPSSEPVDPAAIFRSYTAE